MKKICVFQRLLLPLLLTALVALPAFPKDEGFNGKWVVDKNASTASFDIPDNLTQKIQEKDNKLAIESTWREPKNGITPMPLFGVMVSKLKLSLDGQETRNDVGPFQQLTKSTKDGNSVVTSYTAVMNGDTISGKWKRTLSDDGKRMTLEIDQKSPSRTDQGKLVFKRK